MSRSPQLLAVKLLRAEYAQHTEALARFCAEAPVRRALSHPASSTSPGLPRRPRRTDRRRLWRSDLEHARGLADATGRTFLRERRGRSWWSTTSLQITAVRALSKALRVVDYTADPVTALPVSLPGRISMHPRCVRRMSASAAYRSKSDGSGTRWPPPRMITYGPSLYSSSISQQRRYGLGAAASAPASPPRRPRGSSCRAREAGAHGVVNW